MDRLELLKQMPIQYIEDTIQCSRCEQPTPESELLEVHAWWLCGICYDDV